MFSMKIAYSKPMVSQLSSPIDAPIFYPDTDGQPMANSTEQFDWILMIEQNLAWMYAKNPQVFVIGDLFWYPVEGKPKIVTAPDVMVVFGRPPGKRSSYRQWEEENIPPQVVFEILSPSNTKEEMDKKLLFFDRYGVEEYYIYDPHNNTMQGWLREESGLEPIAELDNWVSPRLEIRFDLSGEELIIYRANGSRFFNYLEISQMLEEERQRAEIASQRAELESQRAELESQRAELESQRAELESQKALAAQQRAELEQERSQLLQAELQRYRERFGDLTS